MLRRVRGIVSLLVLCIAASSSGCIFHRADFSYQANASFDVTVSDARQAMSEMRDEPKPLERPLVVLGGFCDPGFAPGLLRAQFRRLTGDDRVIGVSFLFCGDFGDCRDRVIRAVDKAFPSDDPNWTSEVDVIGVSMGGLVARYAAAPHEDDPTGRRLRVARLFTIGTPHGGASLAVLPTWHRLQLDMREDSAFLRRLQEAETGEVEIIPYVRLGDRIVGAQNAAPHGKTPWWLPAEPLQDSHIMATMDARIIADVARRLRGEPTLTSDPPEPLPLARSARQRPPQGHGAAEHGTSFASR